MKLEKIPLEDIFCDNDFNCRGGQIRPMDVLDLSQSIAKEGLLQPITVQPWTKMPGKKYRIIAGHRRYTAMKLVDGATHIEAIVNESLSEIKARTLNLLENISRKDLNIKQEAQAILPYWKAGWDQTSIAQELSQTVNWVKVRLDLSRLPEDIQDEAAADMITQEQIKALYKLSKTPEKMYALVRKIKENKINHEKRRIDIVKKPMKALTKKVRSADEMFKIMGLIQDQLGNSIVTRTLAWSAGHISLLEYMRDLENYGHTVGKTFKIPTEIVQQAFGVGEGMTVGGTDLD